MAIREQIVIDGEVIVHFVGIGQKDYALCGQDLAGDTGLGWEPGEQTKEKVNCPNCIATVEFCKKIKRSEFRS